LWVFFRFALDVRETHLSQPQRERQPSLVRVLMRVVAVLPANAGDDRPAADASANPPREA
jgi:hypothetical protein